MAPVTILLLSLILGISLSLHVVGFTYGQSLKSYEIPLLGIRFQYPSEWKIGYERANGVGFYLLDNQSKTEDILTIRVEDSMGVKDMKQFLTNAIIQYSAPKNFSSLKLTETNLSSLPAMNATFNFKDDRHVQGVYTIKDDTSYGIVYAALPDTYSNHIAEVNNIIKSFEIAP